MQNVVILGVEPWTRQGACLDTSRPLNRWRLGGSCLWAIAIRNFHELSHGGDLERQSEMVTRGRPGTGLKRVMRKDYDLLVLEEELETLDLRGSIPMQTPSSRGRPVYSEEQKLVRREGKSS